MIDNYMIDKIASSINVGLTKFVGEVINKSLHSGKETPEARETRIKKALENTTKVQSVPQVSDSKKENREYNGCGRYLSDRSKRVNREYNGCGRHLINIKA